MERESGGETGSERLTDGRRIGVEADVAVPTEPAELVDLVQTSDWDGAVAWVRANYVSLVCDHFPTITWFYRAVPADVVDGDPLLEVGREIFATTYGRVGRAGDRLPDDPTELDELGRAPEVREVLSVATGRAIVLRRSGFFHAALGEVEKVSRVSAAASRHRSEEVEDVLATLELQWGITRQLAGDLAGSIEPLTRSYSAHMRRAVELLGGVAASHTSLSYAMMGLDHDAAMWFDRQASLPQFDGWVGEMAHVPADVARTLVALDRLDRSGAEQALEPLLALHQMEEFWAFAAYVLAQYELVFGHPIDGMSRLGAAGHYYRDGWTDRDEGISGPLLDGAAIDLHLAAGQGSRAAALLARHSSAHPRRVISAARLAFKTGDHERVIAQAREELWNPASTPRTRAELSLLTAAAEHQRGDEEAAAGELARAVALVEQNGLLRALTTVPRVILDKLAPRVPGLSELLGLPVLGNAREIFSADVETVSLTDREHAVLQALSSKRTVREIADAQFVSLDTVRSHRRSLYRKLGVHTRADAVIRAREQGLL